ncbi:MAG: hypothetical protein SGCHY_004394 [Lobulomycetales sp.]
MSSLPDLHDDLLANNVWAGPGGGSAANGSDITRQRSRGQSLTSFPPAPQEEEDEYLEILEESSETSRLLPTSSSRPRTGALSMNSRLSALRKRKVYASSSTTWLHRTSGLYDEEGDEPSDSELDGNGLRVWYDDYTTLDWIHDITKDRLRVRKMRNKKGWKATVANGFDAMQAWILVFIIGVVCGTLAAGIEKGSNMLTYWKIGYCSRDWLLELPFCCPFPGKNETFEDMPSNYNNASMYTCSDWIPWSKVILGASEPMVISSQTLPLGAPRPSLVSPDVLSAEFWIDYSVFVVIGTLLAFLSSVLVFYTSSSSPVQLPVQPSRNRERSFSVSSSNASRNSPSPAGNRRLSMSRYASAGSDTRHLGDNLPRRRISTDAASEFNDSDLVVQIRRFHSAHSGIPELKTILSGFVIRGFLGLETLIVKTISLTLSVASGLMIGKQGPLIHISCCVGNVLSRMFHKYSNNDGKRREILSASSAAGVAVAFGSPIGGVLFSLEEVSYYFPSKTMWRSFFSALIATATIRIINPLGTGKLVIFQASYNRVWHAFELVPFCILGVIGGLFGAWLIRFCSRFSRFKQRHAWIRNHPIGEVALVACITGAVSWIVPFASISNSELVADLFRECDDTKVGTFCGNGEGFYVAGLLLFCMIAKVVLLILGNGVLVAAGIFIPVMTIGACLGRVVGMSILYATTAFPSFSWFGPCAGTTDDCVIPGVYAMVGAAAFLCGVTRMTVSLVVIMFELTGALTYALPIMASIMISKWVADALCPDSIFDQLIESNGYPFLNNKKEYVHKKSIMELIDREVGTIEIARRYTLSELESKLRKAAKINGSDSGLPILEDDFLAGYIAYTELEHAIAVAKDSDREDFPCFFRRNYPSRDSQRLSRGTPGGSNWTRAGLNAWESTDIETDSKEPNDFTKWMDQSPITVSGNASMELVMELFAKLGVRTVLVVQDGRFLGVLHKKKLLAFELMDWRGDGGLDDIQFIAFLQSATDLNFSQAEKLFEVFDTDRSGSVEFDEFYLLVCILVAVANDQSKQFMFQHWRSCFELLDEDGSKAVSKQEFETLEFDVEGHAELGLQQFHLFSVAAIDMQYRLELLELETKNWKYRFSDWFKSFFQQKKVDGDEDEKE